jgi:hypothetical protein
VPNESAARSGEAQSAQNLFARVRDDVVLSGINDWVGLWEVVRSVQQYVEPTIAAADEVQDLVILVIEKLLAEHLVEIGDLHGLDFHPWSISDREALTRVRTAWHALGRDPSIGEVCWLNNTDQGDALAQGILTNGNDQP